MTGGAELARTRARALKCSVIAAIASSCVSTSHARGGEALSWTHEYTVLSDTPQTSAISAAGAAFSSRIARSCAPNVGLLGSGGCLLKFMQAEKRREGTCYKQK